MEMFVMGKSFAYWGKKKKKKTEGEFLVFSNKNTCFVSEM